MNSLLQGIENISILAKGTKLKRFLFRPGHYVLAQFYRHLVYPIVQKPLPARCKTFWGEDFNVMLPAALDIYLTGGKTHSSEIRLSKYVIKNIQPDAGIIDAGAHFGFYTLLFAKLAPQGKVISFEASSANYAVLLSNIHSKPWVETIESVVSDAPGPIAFYEYPVLYSEYSTINNEQFVKQHWNKRHQPVDKASVTIDEVCAERNFIPAFIKIDVEGAENKVIRGAMQTLKKFNVQIAMEFLSEKRNNQAHREALHLLNGIGYQAHRITESGDLKRLEDIEGYLSNNIIDSDNIIFIKHESQIN